jgi:hypothetical protein
MQYSYGAAGGNAMLFMKKFPSTKKTAKNKRFSQFQKFFLTAKGLIALIRPRNTTFDVRRNA